MARVICSRCHYPEKTCVCEHIETLECSTEIIILQHPDETQHAKGSARLVSLTLSKAQCVVGETADDFSDVVNKVVSFSGRALLLFPCDESIALEQAVEHDNHHFSTMEQEQLLIVIDGTWRKALKIYKQNSWLQTLQAYHFSQPLSSNYYIRRSDLEYGVSTLEAVAYYLELIENINTRPLLKLFDFMQQQQTKLMPEAVRQRYR